MQRTILIAAVAIFLSACTDSGTTKQEPQARKEAPPAATEGAKSLPSEVSETVGNTTIRIAYTAPAARGRTIWGALVPYNKVWVTGAHNATTLEVGKAFRMGATTVPAGKYALFTIPGKEQWTIILNKNWNQHQADEYKESEDLVRLKAKPETTGEMVERLKYEIHSTSEQIAGISISWEKLRVPFSIEIL